MGKVNVNSVPRTKLLTMAVTNIQNRVNQFKSINNEALFKEEYGVDYNIAGKSFVREPSDNDYLLFKVGTYKIDTKVDKTGQAEFEVHFDNVDRKIKNIFILTKENE